MRYLILSILPSTCSNNTYEDKTQNKVNLDTVKNHIPKSLFSKVSRVTTTDKVHHKTTNASRVSYNVQKKKEKVLCYLFDTVQRHHSIYLTSKQKWYGSKHQPVGSSCLQTSFYAVKWGDGEARRGLAPWKLNLPLIARPPIQILWQLSKFKISFSPLIRWKFYQYAINIFKKTTIYSMNSHNLQFLLLLCSQKEGKTATKRGINLGGLAVLPL